MLIKEVKKKTSTGIQITARFSSTKDMKLNGRSIPEKYMIDIFYIVKTYGGSLTFSRGLHNEFVNNKPAGLQSMINILDRKVAELDTGFEVAK